MLLKNSDLFALKALGHVGDVVAMNAGTVEQLREALNYARCASTSSVPEGIARRHGIVLPDLVCEPTQQLACADVREPTQESLDRMMDGVALAILASRQCRPSGSNALMGD